MNIMTFVDSSKSRLILANITHTIWEEISILWWNCLKSPWQWKIRNPNPRNFEFWRSFVVPHFLCGLINLRHFISSYDCMFNCCILLSSLVTTFGKFCLEISRLNFQENIYQSYFSINQHVRWPLLNAVRGNQCNLTFLSSLMSDSCSFSISPPLQQRWIFS